MGTDNFILQSLKKTSSVSVPKQWRALLIFSCYRICLALALLIINYFDIGYRPLGQLHQDIFVIITIAYLTFGIFVLILAFGRFYSFKHLTINQGIIDLCFLSLLIYVGSGMDVGLGVLMNISVAAFSILIPGKIALFFAALASILLLTEELFIYLNDNTYHNFFTAAMHSISFFATATIAQVLSVRIRSSQSLAYQRAIEIENLQQLNNDIIHQFHAGVIVIDKEENVQIINERARELCHLPDSANIKQFSDISIDMARNFQRWKRGECRDAQPLRVAVAGTTLILSFSSLGHKSASAATLILLEEAARVDSQAQQLKLVSLGRLTASIAHEIRNPLGAVSHAAQLLAESKVLDKEGSRLIEIVQKHADRINSVIKDIFQLSRKAQNKQEVIHLKQWLDEFAQSFMVSGHGRVTLHIDIVPDTLSIYSDKTQMFQILTNLCENSVLHTNAASKAVKITVRVRFEQKENNIYIDIIDNGPGINESALKHIFEPFYTTKCTGVGLGLYIAKELCETNQAQLEYMPISSGACFRIVFHCKGQKWQTNQQY